MTLKEAAECMRKSLGASRLERWAELFERLAESEEEDMLRASEEPVMARSCPMCGTLRPHHIGCPYA